MVIKKIYDRVDDNNIKEIKNIKNIKMNCIKLKDYSALK